MHAALLIMSALQMAMPEHTEHCVMHSSSNHICSQMNCCMHQPRLCLLYLDILRVLLSRHALHLPNVGLQRDGTQQRGSSKKAAGKKHCSTFL
jgi:hypothetical protein